VSVGASPFRELTSGIPRGDRRNATLRASWISQERDITVENFASANGGTLFRTKRQTHVAGLLYGTAEATEY